MKILIDARWDDGNTGIGRVYKEVMLRKPSSVYCEYINDGFSLGSPLSPLYLSNQITKSRASFFYSPSFMPPLFSKIPYVVTVHDVTHLYYYSKFHAIYFKNVLVPLFKNAKKIITVSNYTQKELLKLGVNQAEVIYNGVDTAFFENTICHDIGRPYILYIGNRRMYKNLENMLIAFAKANIPNDYLFAISGEKDDYYKSLIEKIGIQDRVAFLGFIQEKDLPKVYRGASLFLYMSLMEGFGLPILEAMASGTPVITSNSTSLIEIANNAAIACNPLNIFEISNSISKLIRNESLQNDLKNSGLENARSFSWDITGNKTWEIIRTHSEE